MFTDSHCHLYYEYYEDLGQILENAEEHHVNRFFLASSNRKDMEEVLDTSKNYDTVFACLGIHPEDVDTYQEEDLEFLEMHLQDEKVIAIGEIGLDYHYTKENKEAQKSLFRKQLDLALKYNIPVVIHSRDATFDTIAILKEYPSVKGVIHSFSGSLETANIYIKMGYKLGVNGVVTFKNSHIKEVIKEIYPSILLETDAPFLTPHPHRGERNEPKYIYDIALFLSDYIGISLEELENITNQNIKEIFDK